MKNINPGEIIKWGPKGIIYECTGIIGQPAAVLTSMEEQFCSHCGQSIGKDHFASIITSPQFQENAETPTLQDIKMLIDKIQHQKINPEPIQTGKLFYEALQNSHHGLLNEFQIYGIKIKLVPYFPDDIFCVNGTFFKLVNTNENGNTCTT